MISCTSLIPGGKAIENKSCDSQPRLLGDQVATNWSKHWMSGSQCTIPVPVFRQRRHRVMPLLGLARLYFPDVCGGVVIYWIHSQFAFLTNILLSLFLLPPTVFIIARYSCKWKENPGMMRARPG